MNNFHRGKHGLTFRVLWHTYKLYTMTNMHTVVFVSILKNASHIEFDKSLYTLSWTGPGLIL